MPTSRPILAILGLALAGFDWDGAHGQGRQGVRLSDAELAALDITVLPDGDNLPKGRGTVARGAQVYADACEACHGAAGGGGVARVPALTGGVGTLRSDAPVKTVNSYWPQATAIFDYTRRAMPPQAPQSLGADDLYAVTAYLLSVDGIVARSTALEATSLPRVRMPNRHGFVSYWPPPTKAIKPAFGPPPDTATGAPYDPSRP